MTITANNQSKTYGQSDPALTVAYAGFTNGDTSAVVSGLTVARAPGETVGGYTITPSGASAANYSITPVTGTLTIAVAPLTITADNQSKAYGQADQAGPSPMPDLRTETPRPWATNLTVARAPGEAIGGYTITPSGRIRGQLLDYLGNRHAHDCGGFTDDHCPTTNPRRMGSPIRL